MIYLNNMKEYSKTARSDGYVEYNRPMASTQATECKTHHKYRKQSENL